MTRFTAGDLLHDSCCFTATYGVKKHHNISRCEISNVDGQPEKQSLSEIMQSEAMRQNQQFVKPSILG